MNIEFDKTKHETQVNNFGVLCKKYNKKSIDVATEIVNALDVLQAADCLADVPNSYRPHPLKGNYKGHFAVNVTKTHRVIFKPNHNDDPAFKIDNYKTISSILIIEIFKDYHD